MEMSESFKTVAGELHIVENTEIAPSFHSAQTSIQTYQSIHVRPKPENTREKHS